MMNRSIATPFFYLLFLTISLTGCKSDTDNTGENNVEEDTLTSAIDSVATDANTANTFRPPSEIPEDKIALDEDKKQTKRSIFNKLGCCGNKEKRVNEDCCCSKVLAEYRKLRDNDDSRIAELKQLDPILGDCRKKLSEAFDLVDNPPGSEDDDLY